MKVRLTKKFAECIDGVELGGRRVGDVIDFPADEARILLAHDWAVALEPVSFGKDEPPSHPAHDDAPLTISVSLKSKDEPV